MPTKISYQTYSGGNRLEDPQDLIGFCRENPFQVLRALFYRNHIIYQYKAIRSPILNSSETNCSGLVIQEGSSPKGCSITQRISSLKITKAVYSSPPSPIEIRKTLQEKIQTYLSERDPYGGRFPNYLDIMDFYNHLRQSERLSKSGMAMISGYERLTSQLCEIGGVALRKAEPLTIGELRDVWEKAKSEEHKKNGVSSMEAGIEGHP